MPLLTPDTLADLAHRTRRYLHGTDAPPAITAELYDRVRLKGRRVMVLVYGPATAPLPPAPYCSLYGVGLTDLPRWTGIGNYVEGVCPIEEHLADLLAKRPPEAGFDLVIVPVPAGVSDVWAYAERTDADARRCAAKASGRRGARPYPDGTQPAG